MIGAIAGLLTLLCALVAGLLIWTAYGVYSGQNLADSGRGVEGHATRPCALRLWSGSHARYAPASEMRWERPSISFGMCARATSNFAANNFASALENMRARDKALAELHPTTDEQKQALAAANSASDALGQARMQMSFALSAPVAYPVLLTVVGWVACLFCGFGLTARGTVTSVVALAVGSIAIASAVLLILDLSNPYSGIVRASHAPLEQALAVMGKE